MLVCPHLVLRSIRIKIYYLSILFFFKNHNFFLKASTFSIFNNCNYNFTNICWQSNSLIAPSKIIRLKLESVADAVRASRDVSQYATRDTEPLTINTLLTTLFMFPWELHVVYFTKANFKFNLISSKELES